MPKVKIDLDYWILYFYNQQASPQGAGTVLEEIREKGISLSEAAIGRQMRVLRTQGLLEKVGKQGHLITPAGKERFQVLEGEKDLRDFLEGIMGKQVLEGTGNLIDRLIIRKALEREAAYQATLNATDEELLKIEAIVEMRHEAIRMNQEYSELAASFHKAILQAARVPLLEALYDFIGISSRWHNFFVGSYKVYKTPLYVSHEKIIKAMKSRDAELAADSMAAHLEDVISNARKLFPGSVKKTPIKN